MKIFLRTLVAVLLLISPLMAVGDTDTMTQTATSTSTATPTYTYTCTAGDRYVSTNVWETYLNSQDPTVNYANLNYVRMMASYYTGLFKWDLTSVTASSDVAWVDFAFYVNSYNSSGTVTLYRVLPTDVSFSQATWNKKNSATNWGTSGALEDGVDYDSTSLGSVSVNAAGWFHIVISAAEAKKDFGRVTTYKMVGGAGCNFDIQASNAGVPALQARLEICYDEATATATRTETPTATETATPTESLTASETPTATKTATAAATTTKTATKTSSLTVTSSRTATSTRTPTSTKTETRTRTETRTATATRTGTVTKTETATSTSTNTPTETCTPWPIYWGLDLQSAVVVCKSVTGTAWVDVPAAWGADYTVTASIDARDFSYTYNKVCPVAAANQLYFKVYMHNNVLANCYNSNAGIRVYYIAVKNCVPGGQP